MPSSRARDFTPPPPSPPPPPPPPPPPAAPAASGAEAVEQALQEAAALGEQINAIVQGASEGALDAPEFSHDVDRQSTEGETRAVEALERRVHVVLSDVRTEAAAAQSEWFPDTVFTPPQAQTVRDVRGLLGGVGAAIIDSGTDTGKTRMGADALMGAIHDRMRHAPDKRTASILWILPGFISEQTAATLGQARGVKVVCLRTSKDTAYVPDTKVLAIVQGTPLAEACEPPPDGHVLVVLMSAHLLGNPGYVQLMLMAACNTDVRAFCMDEPHNSGARNDKSAWRTLSYLVSQGGFDMGLLTSATLLQRRREEAQHYAHTLLHLAAQEPAARGMLDATHDGDAVSLSAATRVMSLFAQGVDHPGFQLEAAKRAINRPVVVVEVRWRPEPAGALAAHEGTVAGNPCMAIFRELAPSFLRKLGASGGTGRRVIAVVKDRKGVHALVELMKKDLASDDILVVALTQDEEGDARSAVYDMLLNEPRDVICFTTYDPDGFDLRNVVMATYLTPAYGTGQWLQLIGRLCRGRHGPAEGAPPGRFGVGLVLIPEQQTQAVMQRYQEMVHLFGTYYRNDLSGLSLTRSPEPVFPNQGAWLGTVLGEHLPAVRTRNQALRLTEQVPQLGLWTALSQFPEPDGE